MKKLFLIMLTAVAAWGYGRHDAFWPPAWAQSAASKDINVVPNNQAANVDLKIAVDGPELRVGQNTKICFSASQAGYVTLWNVGTSGRVARLFPYTADGAPVRIEGGRQYCAGDASASHAFRVDLPYGVEDSYLVWTRTPEAQPRQPSFADARGLAKDLTVVERLSKQDWATAKASYNIVPATGAVVLPAPPVAPATQTAGGQVFIVAMGADVGELSKTNDDAKRFAEQAAQLFRAPAQNVRFIRNATRRDFEAGMAWLAEKAGPNDTAIVFFSGHGGQLPDDDGDEADGLDEAFITYDVQNNPNWGPRDVVRDDEFARMVNRIPTNRIVSVLDTCHSGGLRKSFTLTGVRTKFLFNPALRASGGLNLTAAVRNKDMAGGVDGKPLGGLNVKGVVLAAAQEDQYALEGAEGSLFTLSWMDAVTRGGTLRNAFDRAVEDTKRRSRGQQTPAMSGDAAILDSVRLN